MTKIALSLEYNSKNKLFGIVSLSRTHSKKCGDMGYHFAKASSRFVTLWTHKSNSANESQNLLNQTQHQLFRDDFVAAFISARTAPRRHYSAFPYFTSSNGINVFVHHIDKSHPYAVWWECRCAAIWPRTHSPLGIFGTNYVICLHALFLSTSSIEVCRHSSFGIH